MGYRAYRTFCIACTSCGALTNKSYARAHNGLCKACAEPTTHADGTRDISQHPLLCPTCHERLRSPYQKAHGYHCDQCTREADPVGYYRELTTPQEPPDY